ncbi:hypothetical protein HO173_005947 [Letharia columbiana]|uniref:Uncharacterized protein n=1 Tax=Letharia columbiana TaxID=112416 RepID=A0A8H6FW38_9LECA|nr:uncharacterized protein HO173_005947 [Letharia columbiana]KAF6235752.1 hypothetical protein HO173_005947 [Letharia columbiana]
MDMMLILTPEPVLSILRDNLHILLALVAVLPTLVLVRTWFKAISLAVELFGRPRSPFPYH